MPIGAARANLSRVPTFIPDSGILRWTFDDADTDSGTATDIWNNNDGAISGATTGVSGANQTYTTNEAYDFDGVDDEVRAGSGIAEGPSLSLAAWVNLDTTGTNQSILAKRGSTAGDRSWMLLYSDSVPGYQLQIFDTDGNFNTVGSTSDATVDGWAHVIATYDGSQLEMYVDGSSENTSTATGSGIQNSTEDVTAGIRSDGNIPLDGTIDDVRVYDKALSDTEASNLYNNGSI